MPRPFFRLRFSTWMEAGARGDRFVVRGREYEGAEPHPYGSVRLRLW